MVKLLLQDSLVPAPIWQILKQGQCDIMKLWIAYFTTPNFLIKIHQPTQVISPISPSPFLSSAPFLAKRQSAHSPIPPIFMRLIVVEIQTHQAWNGHTWMNQGWWYVESANLRVGDLVVFNILSFEDFTQLDILNMKRIIFRFSRSNRGFLQMNRHVDSQVACSEHKGRMLRRWIESTKSKKHLKKSWGVSKLLGLPQIANKKCF